MYESVEIPYVRFRCSETSHFFCSKFLSVVEIHDWFDHHSGGNLLNHPYLFVFFCFAKAHHSL